MARLVAKGNATMPNDHLEHFNTKRAAFYGLFSIAMLCIGILVGKYLIDHTERISQSTSVLAYYVLLVIVGLAAALCLFGAMRSTANLSGHHYGVAFDIGGPAALFVIVVLGGVWQTDRHSAFDLTILLITFEGPFSSDQSPGSIHIDLDSRREHVSFNTSGEAIVRSIPSSFRGRSVPVRFQSERYELTESSTAVSIPIDSAPLYLLVAPVATSIDPGKIFGPPDGVGPSIPQDPTQQR